LDDLSLILALGSLYALLGAGIVVVYRTSRVLNFAQGELAIVGGYGITTALAVAGGSVVLGLGLTLVVAAIVGAAIYFVLMRPILGEAPYVGVLVTIGLAIFLRSLMVFIWEGRVEIVDLGETGSWNLISDVEVPRSNARTFIGCTATFIIIYLIYQRSRLGVQMRAVAENVTLAAQRGINVDVAICTAWAVAVVAAAVGGALYGSQALLSVPAAVVGVKAITAALIGGLDSLKGAYIGGLVVAGIEFLTTTEVNARYADIAPILILLLVLTLRPWGLFGTAEEVERV
jgi:branched-chain amino acid transport system permease protein